MVIRFFANLVNDAVLIRDDYKNETIIKLKYK